MSIQNLLPTFLFLTEPKDPVLLCSVFTESGSHPTLTHPLFLITVPEEAGRPGRTSWVKNLWGGMLGGNLSVCLSP